MPNPRHVIFSAVLTAIVLAIPSPGHTKPSLQLCKKLETELASLESQGVAEDLEKGPKWAKAHLAKSRLTQIARYLTVYEHIEFQCEDAFAIEEAAIAAKIAQEEARKKALANIPPPPERRPKIAYASTKTGIVRIPPLPERHNR